MVHYSKNKKSDSKIFNSIWPLFDEIKSKWSFGEHATIESILHYAYQTLKLSSREERMRDACPMYTQQPLRHHCTSCHKKMNNEKVVQHDPTIPVFFTRSILLCYVLSSKQFIRMQVLRNNIQD